MGHIKEPEGNDLVVAPKPLADIEREQISKIISHYHKTGHKNKLLIETISGKASIVWDDFGFATLIINNPPTLSRTPSFPPSREEFRDLADSHHSTSYI